MAVADEYCMRANEIDPVERQVVDWTTTTLCDRRTKRNQSGEAGLIVFVDMRLDRCTWSENNRKNHAGSILVVETRRRTFKLMCGVPNLFAWHRDRDSLALALQHDYLVLQPSRLHMAKRARKSTTVDKYHMANMVEGMSVPW